jgi:hypothetical protein
MSKEPGCMSPLCMIDPSACKHCTTGAAGSAMYAAYRPRGCMSVDPSNCEPQTKSTTIDRGQSFRHLGDPRVVPYSSTELPAVYGDTSMSYTSRVRGNRFPDSGQSRDVYNTLGHAGHTILAPGIPLSKKI